MATYSISNKKRYKNDSHFIISSNKILDPMENTEMTRSRSALTITTNVDDIISEDPYDNELTLTGDELFRAVQKVTSENNGKNYTKEFKEFSRTGLENS